MKNEGKYIKKSLEKCDFPFIFPSSLSSKKFQSSFMGQSPCEERLFEDRGESKQNWFG